MIVAATYPFMSPLGIRTRTTIAKFAINDRLDDVDVHLRGRFDPRHLGGYLCPMNELAVLDGAGSRGMPLCLIIGSRAVEPDEAPGVFQPAATDRTPPLHPCQNRPQHLRSTPPTCASLLPASGMDARRVKTRDAGLQLRRQPGSGGRRPAPRKMLKFTLSLPDVQCLRATRSLGRILPDDAGVGAEDSNATDRTRSAPGGRHKDQRYRTGHACDRFRPRLPGARRSRPLKPGAGV